MGSCGRKSSSSNTSHTPLINYDNNVNNNIDSNNVNKNDDSNVNNNIDNNNVNNNLITRKMKRLAILFAIK